MSVIFIFDEGVDVPVIRVGILLLVLVDEVKLESLGVLVSYVTFDAKLLELGSAVVLSAAWT